MMKVILVFTLSLLTAFCSQAAEHNWHGKKAAVVLTYDDALSVHLDNVLPVLDAYGMRGTFYLTISSEGFKQRIQDWRLAAFEGHELGNHTLFHPCDGSQPGRDWVTAEKDLSLWSKARFLGNVEITNVTLEAVDGKRRRTFAYTCGDTKAGEDSFLDEITEMFPAARGVNWGTESLAEANLSELKTISVMDNTADELIAQVDQAIAQHHLLVFLFHGVGGGHDSINVSQAAHDGLIQYLAQQRHEVWIAPMIEVADYIRAVRAQ
ncbi:Polysaccharide deacetylase [Vibrio aerogenes CECT 7868]|uniref:Polysaccharide deacetylase n=1 Tax=Vibrio aerogenes CECT 7868 TaxID=1216006 RepID=A0A1M6A2D0_9VIBR|nr:polysaccharide deacetylase family protein [Vibrio aerogenes]SHI30479.1 Polysaccharide deacetylase [Vibrio aerogenes CECT 7868]